MSLTSPDSGTLAAAARMRDLADVAIALRPEDTGEDNEQPAHDLGRALAMWSIALAELAHAGVPAFTAGFGEDPPIDTSRSTIPDAWRAQGDALAWERGQHRLLTATMTGDIVLDAFAWAELVRRTEWRPKPPGKRVPVPWQELMAVLDQPAAEHDPMRAAARYLDVTLDAARDMLVAHRDPHLIMVRGASNWGLFTVDLTAMEDERLRAALDAVRALLRTAAPGFDASLPVPVVGRYSLRTELDHAIDIAVAACGLMNAADRMELRRAYRIGGMHSPPVPDIAERVADLVDRYLEVRKASSGPT